ncbi:hypothetical protein [Methylibium petroleiphilum]|uniref:Uncharacterized protein n=1 Tax=Methylibium petroleiphilum (strain ATCC BAA-1232 / LMG 22953 / PM1) TaxID=420662 RepID=A2SMV3_METPP|nr:hypothetical protein [Methylibium petroleiphilum]ABM96892.1 hypothetical protein Mpe_B0113 [Methylibium petroleiphilum PM1]
MTKPARAPATATLVAKAKRAAKSIARSTGMSHTEALERAAADAGYSSWHELQRAHAAAAPAPELLVDPKLPRRFDQTPNEERSKAHLDAWWDRPFALRRPDGQYDVRCLDGGAWDRSTWYGLAPDLEAAKELAVKKLAAWRGFREAPVVSMTEGGEDLVVRMPQRPDQPMEILYRAKDHADAGRWLREHREAQQAAGSGVESEKSTVG